MERLKDVTLEQVYQSIKKDDGYAFAFWTVDGNYLELENYVKGENVKTCVFLSDSIFLLGLSAEVDGVSVMASVSDFLDIWDSMKVKYPNLFEKDVKGDVMLIP